MTPLTDRIAAARRTLEAIYGLSLQSLGESQIVLALVEDGRVLDPSEPASLERILDRLPIDESWLFRDEDLWTWLENDLGKAILERSMIESRPARLLSIGCSSGQEAFSLAMLFQGLLQAAGVPPSAARPYVEILGVDPSPARIAQARAGRLNKWSVERCRAERLRDLVTPEHTVPGQYSVDDRVRALCRFEVGNLVDIAQTGSALDRFDLILCRHVLIYFSPERANEMVERLACGMAAGSVLVVAAAESHLLARARLAPLNHLGGARIVPPSDGMEAVIARPRSRPALRRRARPSLRRDGSLPPTLSGSGLNPTGRRSRDEAAGRYISNALAHARGGRSAEAVREARAALFLDPRDLFSRFLLGRELIAVDAARGRRVLEELLEHVARLSPEGEIPSAPGLSAGQMAAATRLLLGEDP